MGEERVISAPPRNRHREGELLAELPDALALVLWQEIRHLRDWAESEPIARRGLFNPPSPMVLAKLRDARAAAGELIGALDTFSRLKASPTNIDPQVVGSACEEVLNWALDREFTRTAVEWAETAAIVEPNNPRRANIAGRVMRNANDYERAEAWFKRGIRIAQKQDNTVEQIWGHLGYGRLFQELGWVEGARKHLGRGADIAWKDGPPSLAASAQHDLAAMLMVRGHLPEAGKRAERALHWYPKNHERIPFFAADAGLMLVLDCRFNAAIRVLRAALKSIQSPSARGTILALGARAYAGAGEPEESAALRRRALKLLDKHRTMEPVTRWHLADAQRLAGNWVAAEAEAEQALEVAVEQNDREIERLTEVLIRLISERRAVQPKPTGPFNDFVRLLTARLEEWSPRPGPRPGPWGEDRAA